MFKEEPAQRLRGGAQAAERVPWYPAGPGTAPGSLPATFSSTFAACLLGYFPRICLKALHSSVKQCCQICSFGEGLMSPAQPQ